MIFILPASRSIRDVEEKATWKGEVFQGDQGSVLRVVTTIQEPFVMYDDHLNTNAIQDKKGKGNIPICTQKKKKKKEKKKK